MGLFRKHNVNGESSKQGRTPMTSSNVNLADDKPKSTYGQKSDEDYKPPPGPPPPRRPDYMTEVRYEPSSQPHHEYGSTSNEEYTPPPGPPPGKENTSSAEYAPPPGPPPGWSPSKHKAGESEPYSENTNEAEPPPYHDWQTAVPDTSLLPPPPPVSNIYSPTSNASNADARKAWDWCKKYPLRSPIRPNRRFVEPSLLGDVALKSTGPAFEGKLIELRNGVWSAATKRGAKDQCLLTNVPLYFPLSEEAPKMSGNMKAVYYEVYIDRQGPPNEDGDMPSLAIGYAAYPYPYWRMPGWERGSLAVHSDDGRRYINNQDGGLDFVHPFGAHNVVGLGIRYWVDTREQGATSSSLAGEVFFTRNGKLEGSWSLQEEVDNQTGEYGNWGVAGDHDLFGAVGTFGEVGFKALFRKEEWTFKLESLPPPASE